MNLRTLAILILAGSCELALGQVYPYYPPPGVTFTPGYALGLGYGHVTTVSGTTYTLQTIDCGGLVIASNAALTTVTVPADGSSFSCPTGSKISLTSGITNTASATYTPGAGVTLTNGAAANNTTYAQAPVIIAKSGASAWYNESVNNFFANTGTANGICLGCAIKNVAKSQDTTWDGWIGNATNGSMYLEDNLWGILTHAGTNIEAAEPLGCDTCEPGSAPGAGMSWTFNEMLDADVEQQFTTFAQWATETGNHTAALADLAHGYFMDDTAGVATLTLPAASDATPIFSAVGYQVPVCDIASAETATIARAGSDTINGAGASAATSFTLLPFECVTLQSDGVSKWWVTGIAGNVLAATSSSIGGSLLAAGACSSTTVTMNGLASGMGVTASPATYPGDGNLWDAYVSAANTATVKVCAVVAGTPAASTYALRAIQ